MEIKWIPDAITAFIKQLHLTKPLKPFLRK